MSRNTLNGLGRWLIGAAFAATVACGATIPAKANDIQSYLTHILECKMLLLGNAAGHTTACITTPLSGPFASIGSTGSGTFVEPVPDKEPECRPRRHHHHHHHHHHYSEL